MINQTLLWLLLLPVVAGIVVYLTRRDYPDSWKWAVAVAVVGLLIVAGGFYISKGSQTGDVEIWSGQVTTKQRDHGTYEQAYDCFCTTDSKGNRTCRTCYETHYTVTWRCLTTVGEYQIDKLDRTNRLVYAASDPPRYTSIKAGDPVARRMSYVNYVQAVPNSLFAPSGHNLQEKFKGLLPAYPDAVFDFYHLNRFVTPGWAPADAKEWNVDIAVGLRELGPKKQVNLIVVIAKTSDPSYEYALREHWEGVNKNDVVLLIGSTAYPKIDFVRVISWTKNELFKVQLRDAVAAKETIDRSLVPLALTHISQNFERRKMAEFEYLDGEIDPPLWLVVLLIVIVLGGAGAVWYKMPAPRTPADWTFGGRRKSTTRL